MQKRIANDIRKFILMAGLILGTSTSLLSQPTPSHTAYLMAQAGLVNVAEADSSLWVQLLYAHKDNFVGEVLYTDLREAMLQPMACQMLLKAHRYLQEQRPDYRFIVMDAARPQSVQLLMWNKVKDTPMKNYVASPGRVSMHSYGVAVDLTLIDLNGNLIDMGTEVDYLGLLAEPRHEATYLQSGKLTQEQVNNRLLLRKSMQKAGFRMIPNEWWHFEACTRDEAKEKYRPIE